MKILGLITEYNPFHNGHKYHLEQAKKVTGATHTIAVMSGNFLQRGEPALTNKWYRAEMAVREGVDLVLELPFVYACNTADLFAFGAISVLHHLNFVDYLCFGSEEGNLEKLQKTAEIILQEPESYKRRLKELLSTGLPFPVARSEAVNQYFQDDSIGNLLQSPNNILGIEYIKSLLKFNSSIQPITIKRIKADYHSTEISGDICSATAIRQYLYKSENNTQYLSKVIPPESLNTLLKSFDLGFGHVHYSDFDPLILYKLRTISMDALKSIPDVSEGLENRIKDASVKFKSYNEVLSAIKTKRYPMTRLQRILIHTLLDLQKEHMSLFNRSGGAQYARVLGFTEKGAQLIKKLKECSTIPIVTNINKEPLNENTAKLMLSYDLKATDVYSLSYPNPENRIGGWDHYQKPFILK